MLRFLHQVVETASLSNFHITVLTVLLSKPNERLKRYHSLRVNLLHCCFVHEMRRLRITEGEVNHVTVCFVKITEYFVHFDMVLSGKLVDDYLIPNLVSENIMTGFVENILRYMNLLPVEESPSKRTLAAADISSSLVLLSVVLKKKVFPGVLIERIRRILTGDDSKFRFCEDERRLLLNTLDQLDHT